MNDEECAAVFGTDKNQGCQVIATVNVNNSENSENGVAPSDTDGNPDKNQGCQVISTVNVNNSENSENGVDPSDTDGSPDKN